MYNLAKEKVLRVQDMYIKKIVLKSIRCFEHIEIDLSSQQGSKMWTLLLGDNGVGKTTILRCIAMALMGPTNASGLLSELYGEWVRGRQDKPDKGTVKIEFDEGMDSGKSRWIETNFERTSSGETNVTQNTSSGKSEEFPWDDIFVCGYGAARRAYGSKDYAEYLAIDSLYTLFNYDAALQNPELILRRLEASGIKNTEILKWIDNILMLPEGSTQLGDMIGITIDGPWGKFMPLGALGDGHQATLTWLIDMFGWMMFYDKAVFTKGKDGLSGIVLLDEIEHHLHPSWQKQIIKLLSDQFPNLQFIATTHSPICAAGLADLPDERCSLELLTQIDKGFVTNESLSTMRGWRYDRILQSDAFGTSTRNVTTEELMNKIRKLYMKDKMTKEEDIKLKQLLEKLKEESPIGAEDESMRMTKEEIRRIKRDLKPEVNNSD